MPNSVVVVVAGDDKTGEVFNAVKKHLDETKAKAKETSDSLGEIGETLKHGLEAAGIAFGAKEIIAQFREVVAGAAEYGETISKAGERTGIAAGTLSVLHYAASVTGTDFDKLLMSAGKMGKNLADAADGNKKLEAAFNQVGVTARDVAGRHDAVDVVLQHLGKTLSETTAPARRLQVAGDLLGKSGQAQIPVLIELAEHFDELKKKTQDAGVYMDQMSAQELKELNAKMRDMEQRTMGAKIAFAEGLSPALEGIITEFTATTGGTNIWTTAGRQAGLVAIEVATAFKWLADFMRESKDEYINLSSAVNAFDYNIGSKFNWTKRYRDQETARRDAALQAMHDSRADHDKMLAQESKFVADMRQVEGQLLNPTAPKVTPPEGGHDGDGQGWKGGGIATDDAKLRALQEAKEHAATAHRVLMDALAKSDEVRARTQLQTLLEINDELHKQGLRAETEYLAQKSQLEEQQFNTERALLGKEQREMLNQIAQLENVRPKNEKGRLETQAKLNQLEAQYLAICDKVTELDERRAKAAREIDIAMANARIDLPQQTPDLAGIFGSKRPNVVLGKQPFFDPAAVEGEAEKFAHGVFDPLFNLGERWDQQWKQIRENMLKDLGQFMESHLFGMLFGDPQGRGGKGWNGMSWEGNTTNPRSGLQGNANGIVGGLLGRFLHRGSNVSSNGGVGSGAGTVPTAAASLIQTGNSAGANGGIQVVLNNTGAPLQVSQTQHQNDGGEQQVIQIMLKQLETNGPVAQGIMGIMGSL